MVRGSTVLVSRPVSVVGSCVVTVIVVVVVVVAVVVSIAASSMELRIGRSVVVGGTVVTASFVVKVGGEGDEMSGVETLFLFLVYLVLAYTSLFTCPIGVVNTFILVIFSTSPSSLTAFLDLEGKPLLGYA